MDIKSFIVLSKEINGNKYTFHMPVGVPYGEAHDAAFSMVEDILELSQKAVEKIKKDREEQKAKAAAEAQEDAKSK